MEERMVVPTDEDYQQMAPDAEEPMQDDEPPFWADAEFMGKESVGSALSLGEPFLPAYNDALVKDYDGQPIAMYSLADYIINKHNPSWTHCEKCKMDGHRGKRVFPSLVTLRGAPRPMGPINLLLIGEA